MEFEYSTLIREKNKGWQYIITYKDIDDKWRQKSKQGFSKKGEARKAMLEMIPLLERQIKSNVRNDKVTLKKFYDMYIKRISLYRERNTILQFNNAIKSFNSIMEIELSKITNMDIQKCVDAMTNKGLMSSTIKIYTSSLKTIFKSAKEDYSLLVEIPSFKIEIRETKRSNSKKALTQNEVEKLLDSVKNTTYYLIFLIAIKSGMRVGEIIGITWDNIDLVKGEIKVAQQWKLVDDNFALGTLKSKNSYRIVPIPETLVNELKKVENIKYPGNRLFKYKGHVSKEVNEKLKPFGVTIHELRHTYATNLISKGMDLKTVAYLMGHDLKETINTYSHVNEDMFNNASNLIKKFL